MRITRAKKWNVMLRRERERKRERDDVLFLWCWGLRLGLAHAGPILFHSTTSPILLFSFLESYNVHISLPVILMSIH
jgi:hypothetical protein